MAAAVYEATECFPPSEIYGLRAQLRSAAVSVSSNIAEGCGRPGPKELARFLGIAIGSACEVESQVYLSDRLGLLEVVTTSELLARVDVLKRRLIKLRGRVLKTRPGVASARVGTYHLPPTT